MFFFPLKFTFYPTCSETQTPGLVLNQLLGSHYVAGQILFFNYKKTIKTLGSLKSNAY